MISRALFDKMNKHVRGIEKVTIDEAKILDGAYRGPLKYVDKDIEINDAIKYDVSSYYPYVMSQTEFMFPVTEGVLKKTNKSYPLEIRKLKIIGNHKYFRRTESDYYDTYQIELMDILGVEYEETNEPKLCYKHPIKGKDLFGYFDDLYDMKQNGNKFAKLMMNATHGQLSRKKEYEIPGDNLQERDKPNVIDYDEKRDIFILSSEQPFKFEYGRIKNFLASYIRLHLVKTYLMPIREKGFDVYLSNVDSILTNATKKEMKRLGFSFGNNMGDLKVEQRYEGKWQIKTMFKVVECK